jgi:hypothetical protein
MSEVGEHGSAGSGVWESFPRATWAEFRADEDAWTDRVDAVGVVVIVDADGTEVDAVGADWWLGRGLAAVVPMPILRAAVETQFPAAWEDEQRIRDERFAQWTG